MQFADNVCLFFRRIKIVAAMLKDNWKWTYILRAPTACFQSLSDLECDFVSQ